MPSPFQKKLDSFRQWAITAFELYGSGDGHGALLKVRTAVELACKIIIYSKWPEARAAQAVATNNHEGLNRIIERHYMAEPQLVSALTTARKCGNKATHEGHELTAAEIDLGIASLKLVAEQLYRDILKIPLPMVVEEAMAGVRKGSPMEMEIAMLKAQIAEMRSQPAPVAGVDPDEMERRRIFEAKVEELLAAKKAAEEQQLAEEPAPVVITPPPMPPSTPAPAKRKHWLPQAAALFLVVAVAAWVFWPVSSTGEAITEEPVAAPAGVHIMIMPFTIMQDDPRLELRAEESIRNALVERARQLPMPLHVEIGEAQGSLDPEAVRAMFASNRTALIFYGELYEPLLNDSGSIIIHYAAGEPYQRLQGKLGPFAFRTLVDEGAAKARTAVTYITSMLMVEHLFTAGRNSEALAILHNAPYVDDDGRLTLALYRGMAYQYLREPDEMEREAREALVIKEDDPTGHILLGRVLNFRGDIGGARTHYERALQLAPDDAGLLVELARTITREDAGPHLDLHRSRELVAKALRLEPTLTEAWRLKAVMHTNDGDLHAARKAWEKVIQDRPNDAFAMSKLGQMLMQTPPMDEVRAERLLRNALAVDSSDAGALLTLAQLLTYGPQKDPALADKLFQRLRRTESAANPAIKEAEADAALERGDMVLARDLFNDLLRSDTANIRYGIGVITTLQQLKEFHEMERVLLQLLQTDPMHHSLNFNLGRFYMNAPPPHSDPEKAEQYLRRALLTKPHDADNMADLANLLFYMERHKEAEELFKRVLAQRPKDYYSLKVLGVISQHQGKTREAIDYYERALAIRNDDASIHGNLGGAYMKLGGKEGAKGLAHFKQAVELSPEAGNHYNLSTGYQLMDDARNSQHHYNLAVNMDRRYYEPRLEAWFREKGY